MGGSANVSALRAADPGGGSWVILAGRMTVTRAAGVVDAVDADRAERRIAEGAVSGLPKTSSSALAVLRRGTVSSPAPTGVRAAVPARSVPWWVVARPTCCGTTFGR